jgi:Virulence factor BrkB
MGRYEYWALTKETLGEFLDDSPFQLAAALAFYTLLSLSPLVLIMVTTAGVVWGEPAVRAELLYQIRELVGNAGAETVRMVLENTAISGKTVSSMVIGIATLLVGATTVFGQLQSSLNQIWDVERGASRAPVEPDPHAAPVADRRPCRRLPPHGVADDERVLVRPAQLSVPVAPRGRCPVGSRQLPSLARGDRAARRHDLSRLA